ncbi:DIS3L [Bugula neritina]|uniref:DIS3L n=1 Tax=Bugula neritina TaxID=10212 RepID=A0A7J7J4H2_BUGNE|nr:DIS3L [Bugula neritina]
MDIFRQIFQSLVPGHSNQNPDISGYNERETNSNSRNSHSDTPYDFPCEEDFEQRRRPFSGFSHFGRSFEDVMKEIDDSFEEMFRAFGTDSMPMFDPFKFSGEGDVVQRGHRSPTLPSSGNVRDHMLRKDGNSSRHYPDDEDINVRSRMLKAPHDWPKPANDSKQSDINWDSALKQGATVNDILDGRHPHNPQTAPSADRNPGNAPRFRSIYRYSSTTTTRKPDGTVETRKVTRDEHGNEKETVEIKNGPS